MGVKSMRTLFENRAGFTLVELVIGLVIIGLLIGVMLGGAFMIKNAKIKRQINDLQGLYGAVYTYFDRFLQLPGDADADGWFDNDSTVWSDIENEELAYKSKRSPFGGKYYFGADTAATPTAYKNGNYILVRLPVDVAENVDRQLDDGVYSTGVVTSSINYNSTGETDIYFFID
jgi:prepilin-type N-terminal cleavage/methylation domain-containing protein